MAFIWNNVDCNNVDKKILTSARGLDFDLIKKINNRGTNIDRKELTSARPTGIGSTGPL